MRCLRSIEVLPSNVSAAADTADRAFHAGLARLTGGLSPAAVALAFADWQLHLLSSPGKCAMLAGEALQHGMQFMNAMVPKHAMFQPWSVIKPPAADRRFTGRDWEFPPFNLLAQLFVERGLVGFGDIQRQWPCAFQCCDRRFRDTSISRHGAPTNFAGSNPKVLRKIMETGSSNFVYGLHNWMEDWQTLLKGGAAHDLQFVVGKDVVVTLAGRLSQRSDRAHSIYADHTDGAAGARIDRTGLDHEVLYSRPFSAQFAGAVPG